jgi:hypothetical protein
MTFVRETASSNSGKQKEKEKENKKAMFLFNDPVKT